ncbi:MAG: DUF1405 domain-containing protein [Promethearchaeota archaeon]
MISFLRFFFQQLEEIEIAILESTLLINILILGNFLGSVIGFFYYIEVIGLFQYSPILWILIPDCPIAVLLLLGVYFQRGNQQFKNYNFFAFIQGIRAATITLLFITFFESLDFPIVFIGHFLLLLQAIAILPLLIEIELSKTTFIPIGITLLNDISDFVGVPGIFNPTLVQFSTIQPIFPWFGIFIFIFDIFLIFGGLGIARFMRSPEISNRSLNTEIVLTNK